MRDILGYTGCNYCVIDFAPDRIYEGILESCNETKNGFFVIYLQGNKNPFIVHKSKVAFTKV